MYLDGLQRMLVFGIALALIVGVGFGALVF